MRKFVFFLAIGALLAGGGYLFYKKVYKPRITYATYRPFKGEIIDTISGVGEIAAKNIYNITSVTGGRVLKIFTDEGEWVKKGDLIATIDPVDLPQKIASMQKQLQEAKLLYKSTQEELKSLQAKKVPLYKTYKRYKNLIRHHYISQAEFDQALANFQSLQATINAKKIALQAQKQKIASLGKEIEGLQTKLARYTITSPIDGYVVAKKATISQTLLPNQPILQLVHPNEVWVRAYIDERISNDIKPGQKATIQLRSSPKTYTGFVKRIEPQADPVTLEKRIDVAFVKLPRPFFLHEQAYVNIFTKKYSNLYKIPLRYIVFQKGAGVWVYKNHKAHFLPIKIIAKDEKFAGVKGVDAKTIILIPSKSKKPLKEGMRVFL